jgi:hypothetical protein
LAAAAAAAAAAGGSVTSGCNAVTCLPLYIAATHPPPFPLAAAGGAGEFTDYYLYITAIQDEHCSSGAVAWALPCLYDDATNRPLLGSANICPESLMNGNTNSGVAVLVHELTHALGFTDDMFDKFIDAEGQPIPQTKVGTRCGCSMQQLQRVSTL